jgi:small conductance mechanosensitive channel
MADSINYKISKEDMEKLQKTKKKKEVEEEKASVGTIIFRVLCAVVSLAYFVLLFFGKFFMDPKSDFLRSIDPFNGGKAPNNLIRVVSLCILTLTISYVVRFFIGKMVNNKKITKKIGVAVIELLGNTVKYVAFLVLVFLVLGALGVNTTELLAGLGILSLILGLGVTSLIEDIVAGIFIIAEKLFDVGDIVVVDGFRGTVVSIGIRSTKFADVGGDILTMRNSSIGSLVNLTDRMSCAALTIPIAPTESLEHVEEVINNHFHPAEIREGCDKMQADPIYLGLCEITKKGVQMLLFIAGCNEADKYDVERALYHAIKTTFDEHNIELGAPGLEE